MMSARGIRVVFVLLLTLSSGLRADTELENAIGLVKAKNYTEAQSVLERTVKADPRNAVALALLAEVHLATRNPAKAAEYAERAIQIDPGKAAYHLLRGNALGAQAQRANVFRAMSLVGDVRGSFEKAVQLEPTNRSARFALFNFYFNVPGVAGGGLGKAKDFAEQTRAIDPSRGHYMKARVLQREKDLAAAQAEYRLAQKADPKFASAYNDLGYLELEMKQVDSALEQFGRQVELDPDNANSYDSLGDGWVAKGRLDDAIAAYRKALSLNPMFFSSMRSLGSALEKAGRRDEAIQHYRQCVQLGTRQEIPEVVTESKARLKALGTRDQ
jgi:tetratricopeptide (TPR) repeat protein